LECEGSKAHSRKKRWSSKACYLEDEGSKACYLEDKGSKAYSKGKRQCFYLKGEDSNTHSKGKRYGLKVHSKGKEMA